eukprot:TRINITY_DN378_c0_g1_i2.p1 TRINITY_DN378_c0_g1~~TRINITY_DN378_c0_g1_i2.p1  ORF type:complete len:138 (-),score=15.80 TRINITY_DN378_c0_g1_i2:26-439(-)
MRRICSNSGGWMPVERPGLREDASDTGHTAAIKQQRFAVMRLSCRDDLGQSPIRISRGIASPAEGVPNALMTFGSIFSFRNRTLPSHIKNMPPCQFAGPPNPSGERLMPSEGSRTFAEIGRAVQQECRDRSRMPSSA